MAFQLWNYKTSREDTFTNTNGITALNVLDYLPQREDHFTDNRVRLLIAQGEGPDQALAAVYQSHQVWG